MSNVAVVTGANSGIGRATALRLATEGYEVYGSMRDLAKGEKLAQVAADLGVTVTPVEFDVVDADGVASGFESVLSSAGRVDVLVNNAGIGLNATVEDLDLDAAQEIMDINVWGPVRCAQAVLPTMRAQGSGHIVNMSSVTGRFAAIGQAAYSASKWALESISESMAQELAPFGIEVSIIEPGVTRTAILPKNVGHPEPTAYEAHYRRMFQFYAAGMANATDPFEVGRVIEHAITTDAPQLRYPVSWGGEQMAERHDRIGDADWIELGVIEDDADYITRFREIFDIDIST